MKHPSRYQWVHETTEVDWAELAHLYEIAPLGKKSETLLQTAFGNSAHICFIYEQGKLIGAGRALADGADCFYLCDIAVHPDFQRQGLGSAIIRKLLDHAEGYQKILLFASAGKEGLYEKFGFSRMKTAMAIFGNQSRARELGVIE